VAVTNNNEISESLSNVDRAAWVFDNYGCFIRSMIRFHIKVEAEAEDLFQDLFLQLVARPIPYEVENVRGFLYKLISDTVKDAFRRIDRYQTRINKYTERSLRKSENRPESNLMKVEEINKMFELIERYLPPKEARALNLRYRENFGTLQVAEKMQVKPRSVSRYVSVGLKKMGDVLRERQDSNYVDL
jgi:RNA polymerase sigma factor (sigma-70 family)